MNNEESSTEVGFPEDGNGGLTGNHGQKISGGLSEARSSDASTTSSEDGDDAMDCYV